VGGRAIGRVSNYWFRNTQGYRRTTEQRMPTQQGSVKIDRRAFPATRPPPGDKSRLCISRKKNVATRWLFQILPTPLGGPNYRLNRCPEMVPGYENHPGFISPLGANFAYIVQARITPLSHPRKCGKLASGRMHSRVATVRSRQAIQQIALSVRRAGSVGVRGNAEQALASICS